MDHLEQVYVYYATQRFHQHVVLVWSVRNKLSYALPYPPNAKQLVAEMLNNAHFTLSEHAIKIVVYVLASAVTTSPLPLEHNIYYCPDCSYKCV